MYKEEREPEVNDNAVDWEEEYFFCKGADSKYSSFSVP